AALRRTRLDRRLAPLVTDERAATPPTDIAASVGRLVYYVAMLFVLVAVFDALGLTIVTTPLTALLAELFAFLPRLLAAVLILLVGWLLARIVSRLVSGLLAATGLDRQAERWGLAGGVGGQRLSGLIGTIVYVLILLPVIAAALDALQLETLTRPVSNMINEILTILPNVVAAVLVVAIAYVVGRLVAELVTAILTGLGVNTLPARLGLGGPPPRPAAAMTDRATAVASATVAGRTPAQAIGLLVQVAIVWFAVIQAFQILGFTQLTAILTDLLALAGRILLGLIIFAVGLWLAQLAAAAIRSSGVGQPALLALLTRGAILVLSGAMALRQIGVANEIITLAFGLLLGAIAVAAALAFGIGGREVAGRELAQWVQAARSGEAERRAEAVEGPSARL
ncbi:MAG TPA: mechanosensitive ion channel, partial [Thermomicrobiales bacterium]|nr:mechanosensitive ion channel [Thermomicrobiales bacterium]